MGDYDMKAIERELYKKVALVLTGSEKTDNDEVREYMDSLDYSMSHLDFEALDDYYENGLVENNTLIAYDLWPMAVGYSLILRYGIDKDEYIEWASKQDVVYSYDLFKLIGIEKKELKKQSQKEIKAADKKEKDEKRDNEYLTIIEELNEFPSLINDSTEKTDYEVAGRFFVLNEEAVKAGEVFLTLRMAKEFGRETFAKEFTLYCKDYRECSRNLNKVFKDAFQAYWSKVKRTLKKIAVDEDTIEKIKSAFFDSLSSFYIKNILDDKYEEMFEEISKYFGELKDELDNKNSREFYGGGFGVTGAIKGMITADILSGMNFVINNAGTTGKADRAKIEFEKNAERLYRSNTAFNIYGASLEEDFSKLYKLIAEFVFDSKIVDQNLLSDTYTRLKPYISKLSDEELFDLATVLLKTFPFNLYTYEFILENFINVNGGLIKWATKLNVHDLLSRVDVDILWKSDNYIKYTDLELSNKDNTFEIKQINNEGIEYDVIIPGIEVSFDESFLLDFVDEQSNNLEIEYCGGSSDLKIWIWGGNEGESDFDKERSLNASQLLEELESFENVNIDDYNQTPYINNGDNEYIHIVACQIYDAEEEAYRDSHLLIYADIDRFLCVAISDYSLKSLDTKSIISNMEVKRSHSVEKVQTLSSLRRDALRRIAEEIRGDAVRKKVYIDDVIFRKRVKTLLEYSAYADKMIGQYLYDCYEERIKDRLNTLNADLNSYILYFSDSFVLTNKQLFVSYEKGELIAVEISNIIEAVVGTTYLMKAAPRIFIRTRSGELLIAYINSEENQDEAVFLTDMLNIALDPFFEGDKNRSYRVAQGYSKQEYIICEKCNKIALLGYESKTLYNSFFCKNCKADRNFINRIVINKGFLDLASCIEENLTGLEAGDLFDDENTLAEALELGDIQLIVERDYSEAKEQALTSMVENLRLSIEEIALNRELFIKAFQKAGKSNCLVEKYDYELPDGYLKTFFDGIEARGQFVIYNNNSLILTDQKLYFDTKNGTKTIDLFGLIEIIPMHKAYGENKTAGFFARSTPESKYKDTFFRNVCVDDVLEEISYINICLEYKEILLNSRKNDRYFYRDKVDENTEYVYCAERRSFTTFSVRRGTILNSISCNSCGLHPARGEHYGIKKCFEVDSKRNKIRGVVSGSAKQVIEHGLKFDRDNDGLLQEYQKRKEEYEARKIEEAKAEAEKARIEKKKAEAERRAKEKAMREEEAIKEEKRRQRAKYFVDTFCMELEDTRMKNNLIGKPLSELTDMVLQNKLKDFISMDPNQFLLYFDNITYISDKYLGWNQYVWHIDNIAEFRWDEKTDPEKPIVVILKNSGKRHLSPEGQPKLLVHIINYSLGCGYAQRLIEKEKEEISKRIYCPFCGKQILRTAKFCNFCGKQNTYQKLEGE